MIDIFREICYNKDEIFKKESCQMVCNILFQGDSITDAGRSRNVTNPNEGLGGGFVSAVAARLLLAHPECNIYNRGVSGNRIGDLYARFIEDNLNISHDLCSILMGINDVGFGIRLGRGASREEFAFMYDHMLSLEREKHPESGLILCQPFVLPVDNDWPPYGNDIFRDYELWKKTVEERGEVVEALAKKWNAPYVRFFDVLKEACKRMPADRLSSDGVHPNNLGSALLADAWLQAAEVFF